MTTPSLDLRRYSFIDPQATSRVREVDPALQVQWNAKRQRFVVIDTAAPGGWEHQVVMVVQEPSGAFRPFDGRTLETLRRIRYRSAADIDRELTTAEEQRQRENDRQAADVAYGLAEDMKWATQQWTPSVAWRDRSLAREQIRKEAGL